MRSEIQGGDRKASALHDTERRRGYMFSFAEIRCAAPAAASTDMEPECGPNWTGGRLKRRPVTEARWRRVALRERPRRSASESPLHGESRMHLHLVRFGVVGLGVVLLPVAIARGPEARTQPAHLPAVADFVLGGVEPREVCVHRGSSAERSLQPRIVPGGEAFERDTTCLAERR